MCALDAYSRPLCESMAKSSKPTGCPHSGTDHLVRNFPFESNTCIRLLRWIGDVNFVGRRIDCDRRWIVKLAVAIPFAAPTRQHLSIGTEFNDPIVALIDDIN